MLSVDTQTPADLLSKASRGLGLIEEVKRRVSAAHCVTLTPEVRIIGEE